MSNASGRWSPWAPADKHSPVHQCQCPNDGGDMRYRDFQPSDGGEIEYIIECLSCKAQFWTVASMIEEAPERRLDS